MNHLSLQPRALDCTTYCPHCRKTEYQNFLSPYLHANATVKAVPIFEIGTPKTLNWALAADLPQKGDALRYADEATAAARRWSTEIVRGERKNVARCGGR